MKRAALAVAIWAALSVSAFAQVGGLGFPGPGPIQVSGSTPVPTYVTGNTVQNGSGSVTTVPVPVTLAAGNTAIVVECSANMLGTDSVTFTDNATPSNTYTTLLATNVINSVAFGCNIGWAHITNAATQVNVNNNLARTFVSGIVDVYSNVLASSPVDGTPTGASQNSPGTGANAVKSANVTTTANGDLIFGFSVSINSTGLSVGTGFTGHQAVTGTYYTEGLIQSTAGAIPATFTATSGSDNTITFTVALKHS
jgi:hypothetical protein